MGEIYEQACAKAIALLAEEEDESEPYKHLYAAADLLSDAAKSLEAEGGEGMTAAVAVLECRRGLVLLETDLVADGERYLTSGLEKLNALPGKESKAYETLKLEGQNSLGALWCNREDFERARGYLEAAEMASSACSSALEAASAVPDLMAGVSHEQCLERMDQQRTMTLFYLAQVTRLSRLSIP